MGSGTNKQCYPKLCAKNNFYLLPLAIWRKGWCHKLFTYNSLNFELKSEIRQAYDYLFLMTFGQWVHASSWSLPYLQFFFFFLSCKTQILRVWSLNLAGALRSCVNCLLRFQKTKILKQTIFVLGIQPSNDMFSDTWDFSSASPAFQFYSAESNGLGNSFKCT